MFLVSIRAEDNDPGASGTVNCQSSHSSFKIHKIEDGSDFLVLLQRPLDREAEEKACTSLF
jgi:hypothetical protein